MNSNIIAALISAGATLGGVFITTMLQTRRIDADNRAALETQTSELRQSHESKENSS